MRHEKSIRSLCQLNGYLIIIILHKRILIKLCQTGGQYKFCIANFSTGIPFKIHFLIKKKFFFFFIKKVEGSEIVGLKIFRSNSQASIIFITYILLKCLLKMSS